MQSSYTPVRVCKPIFRNKCFCRKGALFSARNFLDGLHNEICNAVFK